MADVLNTCTACSEEITIENIQTVDNNQKFIKYNSKFRKLRKKERKDSRDSVEGEKADAEKKDMVDENINNKVDSVVCKEKNEEDHYSNTNEINIDNNEEKLQEKLDIAKIVEKNNKDFKEPLGNKDEGPEVMKHNIIPKEKEHCNSDQNIDNNSSLIRNETKDEEMGSNITREENDIQATNTSNYQNQSSICGKPVEDQSSICTMNDDLELDDTSCFAQPIPTLKELAESDYIHNRQLAARKIFEALQQARSNEKELHSVIAIMCKLSEDEEVMVRLELVQQIPSIALHFQDDLFVKIVIRQQLIPYIVKLLTDLPVIPQIRKAGQSALLVLLENNLIDQSQLTEWICPLVAMWETNPWEIIVDDVSLMTKMIPIVGREITLKFFLKPYISLSSHLAFEVRKICALGFGNLCSIVGEETTELSLLPFFLKLCKDRTYGVRKACAEVFVDVAKSVSLKARREILSQVFLKLLSDDSNYVKCSAYQSLGGFIHTFAGSHSSHSNCLEPLTAEKINTKSSNAEPLKFQNNADATLNKQDSSQLRKISQPNIMTQVTMGDNQKSLAVEAKDGHVYLHVNNENLFNNFQFWRLPIPEVELDIDIEPGKATNIHIRAKVQGMEESAASEIKVHVASDQPDSYLSSIAKRSLMEENLDRILEDYRREEQSLLDDDSKIIQSSFSDSILAFKDDSELCIPEEIIPINQATWNLRVKDDVEPICDVELRKKKAVCKTSLFNQDIVPPDLLYSYISPVHYYRFSDVTKKQYDDEMMGNIAFSFPAVAFTLGPKYWHCIKGTCSVLAREMKWTVRRTIASSLHELANILGYEIIMADLFPIFLDFLQDVDEVRLRLVQHLADFLKHVTPDDRRQFLPFIENFTIVDSEKNWRFRFAVAEQLKKTAELYDAVEISQYFLPIASSLLHDRISSVRLASVELIAYLLKRLYQDCRTESTFNSMLDDLDSLYRLSPKWILRQIYVKLCEELAKQESISMEAYAELIIPKLFSLAWDAVPNIRLCVMRCIVKTLLPMGMLPLLESNNSYRELLHKVLDWMKYDTDNDVRHFAVLYNNVSQSFVCP